MSADDYRGQFSVCQFFCDGTCEYVRRWVSEAEAVRAFKHYTDNVATKVGGIVERVVITDGLDFTNLEWVAGKGYSYDGVHYAISPHSSMHPNAGKDADP